MEVIPAIDLRGGRCVRLRQGDYSKETVFSDDPVAMALKWQSLGAPRLHVVDLDGAASGVLVNATVVEAMIRAVSVPVQVGGGVRDMDTLEALIRMGAQRVIIGTAAVEQPELVRAAATEHQEAVVVGVDAREGMVAVRGWKETTSIAASDLASRMAKEGVRRFIYTDIHRDGTMTEPNFQAVCDLVGAGVGYIIASGGVSRLEHIKRLKETGVEGVIVGRALYDGVIDLAEAIAAAA